MSDRIASRTVRFDLHPTTWGRLQAIKTRMGASTNAEVFRRALRALEREEDALSRHGEPLYGTIPAGKMTEAV